MKKIDQLPEKIHENSPIHPRKKYKKLSIHPPEKKWIFSMGYEKSIVNFVNPSQDETAGFINESQRKKNPKICQSFTGDGENVNLVIR